MGQIHFIGGEKGGVGKSLTARLLSQYLIDHEYPFIGFDTDQSHQTFSRFYREFTTMIKSDQFESLDDLIQAAEDNPKTNIVVDLAAQTSANLNKWIQASDAIDIFRELNFNVFYWHVMDDGVDSSYLLEKW